jgi:hypothetical protein
LKRRVLRPSRCQIYQNLHILDMPKTGLDTRFVNCRIDRRLWEEFKRATYKRGLTASEVLRRFISDYVEEVRNKG